MGIQKRNQCNSNCIGKKLKEPLKPLLVIEPIIEFTIQKGWYEICFSSLLLRSICLSKSHKHWLLSNQSREPISENLLYKWLRLSYSKLDPFLDHHNLLSFCYSMYKNICIRPQEIEKFSSWYLQSFNLIWDLTGSMIREGAALASEKFYLKRFKRSGNIWKHEYCIVS